ncbi:DUF6319 family protein [Kribbella deserti]|uniref:DUF6319 family protein n=1 Tax=Kribbella deserti TaxID=1926257 RepID=A0ABV6QEH0_9ACTN
MTVDTLTAEPGITDSDTQVTPESQESAPVSEAGASQPAEPKPAASEATAEVVEKPKKRATAGKKTKTMELTLTVTGTADGEWTAELKQGSSYLARGLAVAAAAVSRAAKELHEDLSGPIDEVIDAAREQQAARVAALEAELEAARRTLADLAE